MQVEAGGNATLLIPGRAVSLQPLLAPAVSSVQPQISVGPAKAGELLGPARPAGQLGGRPSALWKERQSPGGRAWDRAAGSLVRPPPPLFLPGRTPVAAREAPQAPSASASAYRGTTRCRSIAHHNPSTCRRPLDQALASRRLTPSDRKLECDGDVTHGDYGTSDDGQLMLSGSRHPRNVVVPLGLLKSRDATQISLVRRSSVSPLAAWSSCRAPVSYRADRKTVASVALASPLLRDIAAQRRQRPLSNIRCAGKT